MAMLQSAASSQRACLRVRPGPAARVTVCRALPVLPQPPQLLEDFAASCPCISAVEVLNAKAKCIHPTRPVKDACPDCPRRKGKSALALQQEEIVAPCRHLEVFAAKSKCVHPTRPVKDACPDCPRRKGKSALFLEAAQENVAAPRRSLSVFAAKAKCVHPTRPVKDACPDCPRRKK